MKDAAAKMFELKPQERPPELIQLSKDRRQLLTDLASQRNHHALEARAISRLNVFVCALLRAWLSLARLQKTENRLCKHVRHEREGRNLAIDALLADAEAAHDSREMWRLARLRGGKRTGPRKRVFGRVPSTKPTINEWKDYLAQDGPAGGCIAIEFAPEDYANELDPMVCPCGGTDSVEGHAASAPHANPQVCQAPQSMEGSPRA